MTNSTKEFATKIVRAAGIAVLASMLATVSVAQDAQPVSNAVRAVETRVLFFDVNSASLSSDAKTIVLSAVDAAERSGAKLIEVAAYAADDESARDMDLAARRADVVKQQIANYGFQGTVLIDEEAPEFRVAGLSDTTLDRRVTLRVGG
jgi:outer membrane protein OmpA-like peptidoglycan-associated protein